MFGIALDSIVLGVVLVVFMRENVFEHMGTLISVVVLPSIAGIIPHIYFSGRVAYVLGFCVTISVLYMLLKFLFELRGKDAFFIMGVYIGCQIVLNIMLTLLFQL